MRDAKDQCRVFGANQSRLQFHLHICQALQGTAQSLIDMVLKLHDLRMDESPVILILYTAYLSK